MEDEDVLEYLSRQSKEGLAYFKGAIGSLIVDRHKNWKGDIKKKR